MAMAPALQHMKAQRSGHIINVSSVAGHVVRPGSAVYAATKTAVRVISEGLAAGGQTFQYSDDRYRCRSGSGWKLKAA
jgi:NADP-dependent 3-hydroxy acid dehydrogenase YdfG